MGKTVASETESGSEGLRRRAVIVATIVAALLCTVFSSLGLLLAICLIPLQWLYYKAGSRAAAVCGGISLILMVGVRIAVYRFLSGQVDSLAVLDIAVLFAMMAALVPLNFRTWKSQRIPAWLRVAFAYAILAVSMGTIGTLVFGASEARLQIENMLTESFAAFGMATVDSHLLNAFIDIMVSCIPVVLLIMVVFNWYVATWFWRRRLFQWSASTALANFRVAEYMVWPLLVSLAGIAAGQMVHVPLPLMTVMTILALGSIFLYFLQGIGIIAAFFQRRRNPGIRGIALPLVCVILFLIPGLNVLALVGLPLVGVLEIWIRMRPVTQTNEVS